MTMLTSSLHVEATDYMARILWLFWQKSVRE